MSIQANLNFASKVGSKTVNAVANIEAGGQISIDEDIAGGVTGSLTVRGSDSAGTVVLDDSGHGIETGDIIDIYFEGGVTYGAVAGVVTGNSIPFTGGTKHALPLVNADVVVSTPRQISCQFSSDRVGYLFGRLGDVNGFDGTVRFVDGEMVASGTAVIKDYCLKANEPFLWYYGPQYGPFGTNPFGGAYDIRNVLVSHGGVSPIRFQMQLLFDVEGTVSFTNRELSVSDVDFS